MKILFFLLLPCLCFSEITRTEHMTSTQNPDGTWTATVTIAPQNWWTGSSWTAIAENYVPSDGVNYDHEVVNQKIKMKLKNNGKRIFDFGNK
jgi:hypothetical protein